MNSMPLFLSFFVDHSWIIPSIGLFVAGLAFMMGRRFLVSRPAPPVEKLSEEPETPFLSITAARQNQSRPERRAAPRRKAGSRVEIYLTDDTKKKLLPGWVVDRSMGGLCLNVEEPLDEGTILNIRPRKAQQTAPWLSIEIRSCRPNGPSWEVGCRFLKSPQWNDLLLFG
ncbi:MAG TPA: PilZ domain-containing protein [Gemmataceae bacterium]